jgi:hypothetical protein
MKNTSTDRPLIKNLFGRCRPAPNVLKQILAIKREGGVMQWVLSKSAERKLPRLIPRLTRIQQGVTISFLVGWLASLTLLFP